ncbi:DeoR/GlpR family DNA-binding transcription regulator [Brytella acorum]|uniref:DeoR/GlpR family DNA-binding transcription regulator n=1 Tax=Brytella acorum TaxID=2959299 RepID=A0AA35UN65_9PROT|nr:DeoR/GlpR family DNA-binding transcription regulator [Brytella acorum]MDF3623409.1 DeoR/GlpR family DNA-binding transcription regulator [Brytella acorum]CAI9120516.1 DeoR/GlpR family DNA-binding transcription regulator [Brytella acorum]
MSALPPPATPRHRQILAHLQERGYASNEDMAQQIGVAVQTIRRDVNQLADQGYLARHHGGASLPSSVENIAYTERQVLNQHAKDAIGQVAASLIPDRSTLFINIGTTTESFARALTGRRELRVVTNNLHVAAIVSGRTDFRTIIAGGFVRPHDGGIVGASTIESLETYRADFGIIGISGIDEDGTLLDFDMDEVMCARTIIRNSRRVILLSDNTKFARHPMGRVGDLSDIDDFVTDRMPPPAFLARMKAENVALHIANP